MKQGFCRKYRILKTDEFSSVFALRRCRSRGCFQVFSAPSSAMHARLGLVIGKRTAKRAHERNYMKRTIREWFRLHKHELPAKDYVVRVRRKYESEAWQQAMQDLQQAVLDSQRQ